MTFASTPQRQLILFGRYPVPGKTKTRLIPALGPLGAAALQHAFTKQLLATVRNGNLSAGVTFCYSGGTVQQVERWLGRCAIDLRPQKGKDLGQRIHRAFQETLKRGCTQAVLVGTDIPQLSAADLREAFKALDHNDLVIGPSRDGGYWLIGLTRNADLFDQIDWGTPRVLSQTMAAARKSGLSVALVAERSDIDTVADLEAWQPGRPWRRPYLSVIIPALNEVGRIETTIAAAQSADCEIIVADGGSADGTADRARAAGASRVILTGRGRALQQNAAAEAARGNVLLFLHADTILPNRYGEQVFETLLDPTVVAGAFRFKTDCRRPGMQLIERGVHLRSTLLQTPYGDQALFVPKPVFSDVGGFPDVAIAEDLALVRRLAKRGRIHIAPGTAVTSGRRWEDIGLLRATIINTVIAAGCLAGVAPHRLAPLYRLWRKRGDR
jgi:hypothetical protein